MKYALLLDTETTGLDPATSGVIEVAVCLYDLHLGCPIRSFASLIRAEEKNDAEHINRIPQAAIDAAPRPLGVWNEVAMMASEVDVIAAHRAEFDKSHVALAINRIAYAGMPETLLSFSSKPWVCTKVDFDWPGGHRGDHLTHLALAYGLGVASAHRALADVDAMVRIFNAVHQMHELAPERYRSLPELFERAARPKKRFVAMVSFEMRQTAKDAGFLWEPARKEWYRMMPPEDTEQLPFRVVQRDVP
jgi:DNA polymerase-3 subunit epsilon